MERGNLILTRRKGESILIGDGIVVTVVRIQAGEVRLSVSAPKDVLVLREELDR